MKETRRSTLRVGVIGCGAISESHLKAFEEQPGVAVTACADSDPDAARRRAEEFAVPRAVADTDALLDQHDLDLVSICVSPKWHAEVLFKSLAAGCHVLVEKPLATSLAEADRMLDAAAASDRIVGVALMHRYLPAYHVLRELIGGGAIGKVRLVRLSVGANMYGDSRFTSPEKDRRGWLVDRDIAGGGVLMSSSIHFLSVVSFVLGEPVARHVTARVRRLHARSFPGIEDDAELWIELDGGAEYVFHESWTSNLPYCAQFVGQCGQLVVRGENWVDLAIQGTCEGPVPNRYRPLLDGIHFRAGPADLIMTSKPLFGGLVADMFESIERGSLVARLPSLVHARNMQAVIAAAYQSEQTGERQAVNWRS